MAMKYELKFDRVSYAKLDDLLGRNGSLELGPANRLVRGENADKIFYILHDTAIATWSRSVCMLNTGGFISPLTSEKINALLAGHGFLDLDKGRWQLCLKDMSQAVNPLDALADPRGAYKRYRFFDNIIFDVNSHEVYNQPPMVTTEDFGELWQVYRNAGGRKRQPNIANGVTGDMYDTILDDLIKIYAADVQEALYNPAECERCKNDKERVSLTIAHIEGYKKEAALQAARQGTAVEHIDEGHLYEHLYHGVMEPDLVYTATLCCGSINMSYYKHQLTYSPTWIQKALSVYLRRRLHKGVTNAR